MPGPTHFRTVGPDGIAAFHEIDEGTALPEGAVTVDRVPGAGEDFVEGEWVTNHRAVADAQVTATVIEEARALKYLEALAIKKVGDLPTGLLKLEAEERGITQDQMADMVLARRAEFVRREVQRQRGQDGDTTEYDIPPGDPLAALIEQGED